MEKNKFPSSKDHLNKTFLEEMGYKLWSTKGTRFIANHRLITIDRLSNLALSFLNAYLIIFGLLAVYQISNDSIISQNVVAFGSTALSILLLVFSQIEVSRDYKLKAHLYHECALELSELYNELRIFKTLKSTSDQAKSEYAAEISTKYQQVLKNYFNHDDIDYKRFQIENCDYFGLHWWKVMRFNAVYYVRVKLLYHALIVGPLLLTIFYVVSKKA